MIQGLGPRDLIGILADFGAAISSEAQPEQLLQALVQAWARDACLFAVAYREGEEAPAAMAARPGYDLSALTKLPAWSFYAATANADGVAHVHREPLTLKRRRIGTLILGFSDPVDETVRAAIRTVGSLTAASVDVAESIAGQREIADRLQRAMLPMRLPSRNEVTFFTAYQPATDETLVGGDWYDVFELDDDTLGFSIGDVTGHGLDAAVAMIEARLAIRSAAAATGSPAALLRFVNNSWLRDSSAGAARAMIGTATAIVGVYDPRNRILRYACAGHPPPVYVSGDRRVIALPGGGLPLGVADDFDTSDWMLTLDTGASVVLYTDGLLEYDRNILSGERRLHATLELKRVVGADDPAKALYETILHKTRNRDDVAVLVIRSGAQLGERLALRYSPSPRFASVARAAIGRCLRRWHVDEARAVEVLTASGEAVANAIEHGSYDDAGGGIAIELQRRPGAVHLSVESDGQWKSSQGRDDRGFGICIMRAMADELAFASTHRTTIAQLRFGVAASP